MTAPQRPTPRVCNAHFAMREVLCSKGCGDICIVAEPEKVNTALSEREEECKALAELNKALDAKLAEMEAVQSATEKINLSAFINTSDISAADLPHIVVEKLQRAINLKEHDCADS